MDDHRFLAGLAQRGALEHQEMSTENQIAYPEHPKRVEGRRIRRILARAPDQDGGKEQGKYTVDQADDCQQA